MTWWKRWYPVAVACALLVGLALWARVLLPADTSAAAQEPTEFFPATLTVESDTLVLLGGDGRREELELTVYALPEDEQARLRAGVTVHSREELDELLENYGS